MERVGKGEAAFADIFRADLAREIVKEQKGDREVVTFTMKSIKKVSGEW